MYVLSRFPEIYPNLQITHLSVTGTTPDIGLLALHTCMRWSSMFEPVKIKWKEERFN